jgi:hypothetical protein
MTRIVVLLLLPLFASALQGAEFEAALASTPHEVVAFDVQPPPFAATGTTMNSGRYPQRMTAAVTTHGRSLRVELEKHATIISQRFEHITMDEAGAIVSRETLGPDGHCVYRGRVYAARDTEQSEQLGDALLSVCDGNVHGEMRLGETDRLVVAPHPTQRGSHVVFQHADYEAPGYAGRTCASGDRMGDHRPSFLHRAGEGHHDRHDASAEMEEHENGEAHDQPPRHDAHVASSRRRLAFGAVNKEVEMLIVNDYARSNQFTGAGTPTGNMVSRNAAIVAIAEEHYHNGYNSGALEYKIDITIVDMVSWASGNPMTVAAGDIYSTYWSFTDWISAQQASGALPRYDNTQLFSGVDFAGPAGVGGLGTMCWGDYSAGIIMAPESWPNGHVAFVLAHELGHNLGEFG